MTGRARILALALAWALWPAAASAAPADAALAKLHRSWFAHGHAFSEPRIGPAGHLLVTATPLFLNAPEPKKREALAKLAGDWARAYEAAKLAPPAPLMLEVRWVRGGWLWEIRHDKTSGAVKLRAMDRWDDTSFVWMPDSSTKDRWFFFLGGQSSSGGGIGSSSGFNARLGTTLFREKYDLAFMFNQTSTGPAPKTKASIYGVVGRMLFKGRGQWGYNLGAQVTSINASGADTNYEASIVLGTNYYTHQGSWDVSLALGDEGSRTMVLGYSLFLTR